MLAPNDYISAAEAMRIDVTDISDGDYVLELEVNAERLFTEANYENNTGAIDISLVKPTRPGRGRP